MYLARVVVCAVLATACSSDDGPTVARIEGIPTETARVRVNDTVTWEIRFYDGNDKLVDPIDFQWAGPTALDPTPESERTLAHRHPEPGVYQVDLTYHRVFITGGGIRFVREPGGLPEEHLWSLEVWPRDPDELEVLYKSGITLAVGELRAVPVWAMRVESVWTSMTAHWVWTENDKVQLRSENNAIAFPVGERIIGNAPGTTTVEVTYGDMTRTVPVTVTADALGPPPVDASVPYVDVRLDPLTGGTDEQTPRMWSRLRIGSNDYPVALDPVFANQKDGETVGWSRPLLTEWTGTGWGSQTVGRWAEDIRAFQLEIDANDDRRYVLYRTRTSFYTAQYVLADRAVNTGPETWRYRELPIREDLANGTEPARDYGYYVPNDRGTQTHLAIAARTAGGVWAAYWISPTPEPLATMCKAILRLVTATETTLDAEDLVTVEAMITDTGCPLENLEHSFPLLAIKGGAEPVVYYTQVPSNNEPSTIHNVQKIGGTWVNTTEGDVTDEIFARGTEPLRRQFLFAAGNGWNRFVHTIGDTAWLGYETVGPLLRIDPVNGITLDDPSPWWSPPTDSIVDRWDDIHNSWLVQGVVSKGERFHTLATSDSVFDARFVYANVKPVAKARVTDSDASGRLVQTAIDPGRIQDDWVGYGAPGVSPGGTRFVQLGHVRLNTAGEYMAAASLFSSSRRLYAWDGDAGTPTLVTAPPTRLEKFPLVGGALFGLAVGSGFIRVERWNDATGGWVQVADTGAMSGLADHVRLPLSVATTATGMAFFLASSQANIFQLHFTPTLTGTPTFTNIFPTSTIAGNYFADQPGVVGSATEIATLLRNFSRQVLIHRFDATTGAAIGSPVTLATPDNLWDPYPDFAVRIGTSVVMLQRDIELKRARFLRWSPGDTAWTVGATFAEWAWYLSKPLVLPDGRLAIAAQSRTAPDMFQAWLYISEDAGATWETPIAIRPHGGRGQHIWGIAPAEDGSSSHIWALIGDNVALRGFEQDDLELADIQQQRPPPDKVLVKVTVPAP